MAGTSYRSMNDIDNCGHILNEDDEMNHVRNTVSERTNSYTSNFLFGLFDFIQDITSFRASQKSIVSKIFGLSLLILISLSLYGVLNSVIFYIDFEGMLFRNLRKSSLEMSTRPPKDLPNSIYIKKLKDLPIKAMLETPPKLKKFEASDITYANGSFYIVLDSSFDLLKFDYPGGNNSEKAKLIKNVSPISPLKDSQFEAITYISSLNSFFIISENSVHDGSYFSELHQYKLNSNETITLIESCPIDFAFKDKNKGFEGLIGVFDESEELYFIGLCEGNECIKKASKIDGTLVLMKKKVENESCLWSSIKVIPLPEFANFKDYSSINLFENNIIVASQESSALWIGRLNFLPSKNDEDENNEDGIYPVPKKYIDPQNLEVVDKGKVYYFPRNNHGEIIYCNIEGIYFVNSHMFVAVSDKAKSYQPLNCLQQDQSFHLFSLMESIEAFE